MFQSLTQHSEADVCTAIEANKGQRGLIRDFLRVFIIEIIQLFEISKIENTEEGMGKITYVTHIREQVVTDSDSFDESTDEDSEVPNSPWEKSDIIDISSDDEKNTEVCFFPRSLFSSGSCVEFFSRER